MADYVMGEQTGRGGRKGNTREERGISKSGKRGGQSYYNKSECKKVASNPILEKIIPPKLKIM